MPGTEEMAIEHGRLLASVEQLQSTLHSVNNRLMTIENRVTKSETILDGVGNSIRAQGTRIGNMETEFAKKTHAYEAELNQQKGMKKLLTVFTTCGGGVGFISAIVHILDKMFNAPIPTH